MNLINLNEYIVTKISPALISFMSLKLQILPALRRGEAHFYSFIMWDTRAFFVKLVRNWNIPISSKNILKYKLCTPLDLTKTPTIRSSARTVNDLQSTEDHHWSSVQKFQKQKFIKSCLQVGLLHSDNFWKYLSTIY